MIEIDESMLQDRKAPDPNMLNQLYGIIRYVDVVGMTSLLDLNTLIDRESIEYGDFRDWIDTAHTRENTDAYVLGVTRNYGRFYAVLVSSIALSTRVEMRSAKPVACSGEAKPRNATTPSPSRSIPSTSPICFITPGSTRAGWPWTCWPTRSIAI